ncbi:hypothetical protein [Paenibacillus ehimensis]|uniref:Transposase n=1 Tax=Paenibacillus ehimensis TaxID=79264 RepID=A0ABT8VHF8_9BACL|nr:hypothetical protein [Paenibacillus ehimensis]MDO3680417.1 hypothetical protein [Paenibacillus ehimensis]
MEWKQEPLYVLRDANGVIVRIEEKEPEGFESDVEWVQVEKARPKNKKGVYWPIGD